MTFAVVRLYLDNDISVSTKILDVCNIYNLICYIKVVFFHKIIIAFSCYYDIK